MLLLCSCNILLLQQTNFPVCGTLKDFWFWSPYKELLLQHGWPLAELHGSCCRRCTKSRTGHILCVCVCVCVCVCLWERDCINQYIDDYWLGVLMTVLIRWCSRLCRTTGRWWQRVRLLIWWHKLTKGLSNSSSNQWRRSSPHTGKKLLLPQCVCYWLLIINQIPRSILSVVIMYHVCVRFIGEESVAAGEPCVLTDDPTWIIDPIDGTTNFVHAYVFSLKHSDIIMQASADITSCQHEIQLTQSN